jgi:N-acyl-D-aspartate/D-glutamate deacylase
MRAIMDTAMRAGAMGMTTALIYPPSSYATTDELVEMAKVAAKYGGGYASHIRGEGPEVVQSVAELITIAEKGGLPGEVFPPQGRTQASWGVRMDSVRMIIDAARARGVDVAADLYVYTAGGTGLEATTIRAGRSRRQRLAQGAAANPATARAPQERAEDRLAGWWNIIEAAGGWDGVILVNARNRPTRSTSRRSLDRDRAPNEQGPADAAMDLVHEGRGA